MGNTWPSTIISRNNQHQLQLSIVIEQTTINARNCVVVIVVVAAAFVVDTVAHS